MQRYEVKITKQASEQLLAIKQYIANDLFQEASAKVTLDVLKKGILSLTTMPQRIKCIDEQPWQKLGFRKIKIKNYYIYFWINEITYHVHVIAVIYAKRHQENQLKAMMIQIDNNDTN